MSIRFTTALWIAALLTSSCGECTDCATTPVPAVVQTGAGVVGDVAFDGDVLLHGRLARAGVGIVTVSIEDGSGATLFAHGWDVADPAWTGRGSERRLRFHLDSDDALPRANGTVETEMTIRVRYDPDGNPGTDETGVAQTRAQVRTGSDDIEIVLASTEREPSASPAAARAAGRAPEDER